jgi:hypothetical protein
MIPCGGYTGLTEGEAVRQACVIEAAVVVVGDLDGAAMFER